MAVSIAAAVTAQPTGREAELEAIRDQIMVLQSRLNRVRQEATGTRGELEQTEIALELQRTRLAEARAARQLAETSLAAVESEISLLEENLAELRGALRDRLVDLYRLGREGYLRLFLSIESAGEIRDRPYRAGLQA